MSIPKRHKPAKPERPDGFPLFAHASGRWAKKVRGRLHYFGKWGDPDAALNKWLDEKDDLLAGRVPRAKGDAGVVDLHTVVNKFLTWKETAVENGELSQIMFDQYRAAGRLFIGYFGRHRLITDITPDDLTGFRAYLAKPIGLSELGKRVQMIRSICKFVYDTDLIDRPVKFGPGFKRPSAGALRRLRAQSGNRTLTADEIHRLIDAAGCPLKSMIYLGLNCAFGASDISALPITAIDLDKGVVEFPRVKTGNPRRCPLWKETVEAIREALAHRPKPKDPADASLLYVTKFGNAWVRYVPSRSGDDRRTWIDSVATEFDKLLVSLKMKRRGVGFYSLRRLHRTLSDEVRDKPAADLIMGHGDEQDMGARYVQWIDDSRLRAITDHIREWLKSKKAQG